MMQATQHRGPDFSKAILINSQVGMAHNRLSILDLSENANQPFVINNRYYLTYNGEIYNYKALRNNLEKSAITFSTNSDTEVLARLLIQKGKDAIPELEGMFAFVFYDSQENSFITSRDYFGIKPLYYYEDDYVILISSEAKGLFASGYITKELNEEGINDYLNFKYVTSNNTIFKNILSLHPKEILVSNNSEISIHQYNKTPFSGTKQVIQEKVREDIKTTLISDVPLGVFLSGGIDSLLIYETIKKKTNQPLTCFYINLDKDIEEENKLKQLCNNHGDTLHCITFETDFENNFRLFIQTLDTPIADSASFLTWLLSKKAKEKGIKTILSGVGGDEQFAGYNRHYAFSVYLKWKNFISTPFLKQLGLDSLFSGGKKRLVKKLISDISVDPNSTWNNFIRLNLPHKTTLLQTQYIASLNEAIQHDQSNYLAKDVLAVSDQSGMAHGVEIRVPLLYSRFDIDSHFLLQHGKKWILKELIVTPSGTKKGFGIFLSQEILNKPFFKEQLQLLKNPNHIIYKYLFFDKTQALIKNHISGKNNYSPEIWALIIITCWLNQTFD